MGTDGAGYEAISARRIQLGNGDADCTQCPAAGLQEDFPWPLGHGDGDAGSGGGRECEEKNDIWA